VLYTQATVRMEKLKSVFRPGGKQDDETLYGSQSSTGASSKPLQTDPAHVKDDKDVSRQILNPGGDKYDETRYGTTAHADKPLNIPQAETVSSAGAGAPQISPLPAAEKDHTIIGQILNPGGDKYDEQRYGATGQTVPGSESSTSKLPDRSVQSTTGGALGSSTAPGSSPIGQPEASSTAAPVSSTTGDRSFPLSGGATTAGEPSSQYASEAPTSQSHLGRDAALGGAGALGAGALAHEATKPRDDTLQTRNRLDDDRPASSVYSQEVPQSSNVGNTSSTAPLTGATSTSSRGPLGADIPPDSFGYHRPDEKPVEGVYHHTSGPHATDIANQIDPHVPGEFPAENGEDRHANLGQDATAGGIGGAALGAGAGLASGAGRDRDEFGATTGASSSTGPDLTGTTGELPTGTSHPASSTSTSQREPEHHYGRDAAVAGGAGAAGLAGYEALKDHDKQPTSLAGASSVPQSASLGEPSSTKHSDPEQKSSGGLLSKLNPFDKSDKATTQETKHEPTSSSTTAAATPLVGRSEPTASTTTNPEHHYGRDAAVAGGAGAAGLAGYEALKDHDKHGVPAHGTPIADEFTGAGVPAHGTPIADEFTGASSKGSTLGGPSTGAGLSTYDQQRVPIDSNSPLVDQGQREHHYGRDVAVAGGAGAAGLGGYEALKHERDVPSSTASQPSTSLASSQQAPLSSASQPPTGTLGSSQQDPYSSSAQPSGLASQPQQTPEHHYGRDAAIAGGAGAAGLGGYEALKHHDQPSSADPQTSTLSSQQPLASHPVGSAAPVSSTTGPTSASGTQSSAYPPSTSQQQQQPEHHYGRDAAIAGGAGAAGVGGYEVLKHQEEQGPDPALAKKQEKLLEKEHKKEVKEEKKHEKEEKEHEKEHEKELKKEEKEHKKEEKKEGGGLLGLINPLGGIHHKDPVPLEDQTHPPSAVQQQPEDRHLGRDAALATGAAGAVGAGAYAAHDHNKAEPARELGQTQQSSGGFGSINPLGGVHHKDPVPLEDLTHPSSATQQQPRPTEESHLGRDAALATGAAGAVGAGAYAAHDKNTTAQEHAPGQTQQSGSGFGSINPLGGVHHKDPVPLEDLTHPSSAAQQQPRSAEESHLGRDAALATGAAGAVGAGAYAAHDHNKTEQGHAPGQAQQSGFASINPLGGVHHKDPVPLEDQTHPPSTTTSQPQQPAQSSHLGRDAALATGAAGAVGAGAYAAHDHPSGTSASTSTGTGEVRPTKEELVSSYQHHHGDGHNKLEKTPHQVEKHERDLEKAREKEAHREHPAPKKEGFLHKILHPGEHSRKSGEVDRIDRAVTPPRKGSTVDGIPWGPKHGKETAPAGTAGTAGASAGASGVAGREGSVVTEPHTGLPMDLSKGT